jgi:hypothetical protein
MPYKISGIRVGENMNYDLQVVTPHVLFRMSVSNFVQDYMP